MALFSRMTAEGDTAEPKIDLNSLPAAQPYVGLTPLSLDVPFFLPLWY